MKKYKIIIVALSLLLIIICISFLKNKTKTNTFINYFILNYLEEMDETFLTLSAQLYDIDNKKEFADTLKPHLESIEKFCFLSRKLKVINSNFDVLDLEQFSIYILDIIGSYNSFTEDDLKYHIDNLKNICNIFISLSNSSEFYTKEDYYKNVNLYNIKITHKISTQISNSFAEIRNLSTNGINKIIL